MPFGPSANGGGCGFAAKDASVRREDLPVVAVLARPQLDGSFDVTERLLPKIWMS